MYASRLPPTPPHRHYSGDNIRIGSRHTPAVRAYLPGAAHSYSMPRRYTSTTVLPLYHARALVPCRVPGGRVGSTPRFSYLLRVVRVACSVLIEFARAHLPARTSDTLLVVVVPKHPVFQKKKNPPSGFP